MKLANYMVKHVIKLSGGTGVKGAIIIPCATGMSLVLSMLTLRARRPEGANVVIWPRIDQKTCFKAALTAGCVVVWDPGRDQKKGGGGGKRRICFIHTLTFCFFAATTTLPPSFVRFHSCRLDQI